MRVTLLRDHPAEGWPSMDRYAESLFAGLRAVAPENWQFRMPMPPQPWRGRYGPLASRMLRYPFWASGQQGELNHVVDHSYGHLLFALDATRTVVTVHDVAPLHFPGRSLGLSGIAWKLAWQGVHKANFVITVSSFIALELKDRFHLAHQRLWVVPNGVSAAFCPQSAVTNALARGRYVASGEKLLLHVGNTDPRKNLPALVQALALLRTQGIAAVLVQVGGRPGTALKKQIDDLGLGHAVRFAGHVLESELVSLYSAADAFVFPSLYEGFGLPVLEALACGTPVVASNAASLPEVVGDAALLVDPCSPQDIAQAVARVLKEPGLAIELRQRGFQRAREFTWEQTALKALAVYQAILGSLE